MNLSTHRLPAASTLTIPKSDRQARSARGLALSKSRAERKGVDFTIVKANAPAFEIQVDMGKGAWSTLTQQALELCGEHPVLSFRARDLEPAATVMARNYPDRKVRVIKAGAERATLRFRYSSKTGEVGGY